MKIINYDNQTKKLTFVNEQDQEVISKIIPKFNMEVISYKNNYYYYSKLLDGIYEDKVLIKIDDKMLKIYQLIFPYNWKKVDDLFMLVLEENKNLVNEDKWETSPDTSTFEVLKSGNIKLLKEPKKIGKNGDYIHKGIQVGTNVKKDNLKPFLNLLVFILLVNDNELYYKNSKIPAKAKIIKEVSYITFGLG